MPNFSSSDCTCSFSARSRDDADQAAVTMLERPRMMLEPRRKAPTNQASLLHMLKNDRVAVL
jgi:hypothetical protein